MKMKWKWNLIQMINKNCEEEIERQQPCKICKVVYLEWVKCKFKQPKMKTKTNNNKQQITIINDI